MVKAGVRSARCLACTSYRWPMRYQLRARPADRAYLFVDPAAVDGAMPGSEVDWQVRIDYAQHTGSALLRWLSRLPTQL